MGGSLFQRTQRKSTMTKLSRYQTVSKNLVDLYKYGPDHDDVQHKLVILQRSLLQVQFFKLTQNVPLSRIEHLLQLATLGQLQVEYSFSPDAILYVKQIIIYELERDC